MPIYRIADLNVEVNPKFKICRKRLESYAVKSNESGKTDIAISVSDDEIRERLRISEYSQNSATPCLTDLTDSFFIRPVLSLTARAMFFRQSAERASLPTRLCGEGILATG